MMKVKNILIGLALVGAFATGASLNTSAQSLSACDLDPNSSLCADQSDTSNTGGGSRTGAESVIKNVINILLYIIGAVSVIVIIIAGIRYTISTGNQQSVTGAKNMLIGGVLGIVVTVFAFAIVQFVFNIMQ